MNINDVKITIKIVRKPNKNIYMRFLDSETLQVSCSPFISERKIMDILEKNRKSLEKMHKKVSIEQEKDHFFWYLGKSYIPVYNIENKETYFDREFIFTKDERTLDKFYIKECQRVFEMEVNRIKAYFTNIPKFTLKIRKMKTRWGVNNRGNNTITLNSDLLKKDIDLLDYVIIHELCHFYEANHSSRFWAHVEKYYPNYKLARKRLRS